MLRAVLFDLDGTLVDTAADLLGTLDDVRAELGLPACAGALPAAVAARGGRGILALGFPDDPTAPDRWLPRYLEIYASRLARCSRPYAGVDELLARLAEHGIASGIVTNKPEALARRLLDELGWSQRFAVLVGGDTLSVRKPAPEPIWHACAALGLAPEQTAMVGDDLRDIEAGRAAGCAFTVAAAYGYLEQPEAVQRWGADRIVVDPSGLAAALLPESGAGKGAC